MLMTIGKNYLELSNALVISKLCIKYMVFYKHDWSSHLCKRKTRRRHLCLVFIVLILVFVVAKCRVSRFQWVWWYHSWKPAIFISWIEMLHNWHALRKNIRLNEDIRKYPFKLSLCESSLISGFLQYNKTCMLDVLLAYVLTNSYQRLSNASWIRKTRCRFFTVVTEGRWFLKLPQKLDYIKTKQIQWNSFLSPPLFNIDN